jgi:putative Holliday junction resolvase
MKIVGLDLGSKTCGIAMSDPSEILASGIETFHFEENNFELPLDYVKRFIDNNKVGQIVLGLPKNMDGSIGFQGQVIQDFKLRLEKMITIPIILWDERLTTRMVTQMMISGDLSRKKRKENVDRLAAQVILQSYLDSRRRY